MDTENEQFDELRMLRMIKRVLTDVAKDTFTKPGLRHPLSESTILGIRDCLSLVTAREGELRHPDETISKPGYIDQKSDKVVVSLQPQTKNPKK
jgi:hypothetical protein